MWFPAIRSASGADVFTLRMVQGLRQAGYRAEVSWLPLRAEYAPLSVRAPVPPDWANVVHINTWLPVRHLPPGLPVLATMHSCVHDPILAPYKSWAQRLYHRRWIKRQEARALRRAARVVAVSDYTARRAREIFQDVDFRVVHNGIVLDSYFQPAESAQSQGPFKLLFVGNWSDRKGADLLLPIMQDLGPGYELTVVGRRMAPAIRTREAGAVRWLEPIFDPQRMAALYQSSDALIFPSRMEGLPLVVLEAMACGLPVICTDMSSLPELVVDGHSGVLCAQDDVSAFASAIRRLAADRQLCRQLGLAARQRAEGQFDQRGMIRRYLALYRELLGVDTVAHGAESAS